MQYLFSVRQHVQINIDTLMAYKLRVCFINLVFFGL